MKLNKKIVSIVLVLFLALLSCGKKEETTETTARPVKVTSIEDNSMSLGYTVSGTLKGIEETPYTATSSGEITVLNVQNGDTVEAGRLIISIDNESARSNLASAQAAFNQASINFSKYSELYSKRLITETDYLAAKTSLESARASLNIARDASSKTNIIADTSGYIANLSLELYQQVNAGESLFTLINENEISLEIGVSSSVIDKIGVGTSAQVIINDLDNREVIGEVYEVSNAADQSTRQFKVKIKIPNPNRDIRSGMYGTAIINTGSDNGIVIPKKAIVVKGIQQVVFVVRDGKSVMIPVTIINQNKEYASVEGEGLKKGDKLVIDGQNIIEDAENVSIVE